VGRQAGRIASVAVLAPHDVHLASEVRKRWYKRGRRRTLSLVSTAGAGLRHPRGLGSGHLAAEALPSEVDGGRAQ